ncbi:SpoIIE family protein phosphatase, partial [Actinoplanes sp. NPDC051633]|uniref:SpoIIE family protein phosphatase n=1 Tax=Actinoplanes sp. NPDC051633 TaxID=3155670 RepID=UPI00342381BF
MGQWTTTFTLSAEIQRRLLPPHSPARPARSPSPAGWNRLRASAATPSDYSLARELLHFSVTDAMGHGVASALTATLGVSSRRNTRRRGAGLVEQADSANTAVADHAGARGSYLTAVLGRLGVHTGICGLLNAD